MGLLQDIEKAEKDVYAHLNNINEYASFQKLVNEMKDHVTATKYFDDFLEALAKEVKKGGQNQLNAEQEKLLKQCHKIWCDTALWGEMVRVHGWLETYMKAMKDSMASVKKLL